MLIYVDVLSGDELFTDAFKIIDDGGALIEVEGKTVTRSENFDDSKISANKSAEEDFETCESSSVSGPDIVLNHNLKKMDIDKQGYIKHIKSYAKRLKEKIEETDKEKAQEFQKGMEAVIKSILKNIKNFDFYKGESMSDDGMIGLLDYREDGLTPYMIFFRDGLRIEKC